MAVTLRPRTRPSRRAALVALVLAVLAVHGWMTGELADRMVALEPAQAMPPRIEVAYVRELQLAAPPAVAPAPTPPPAAPARAKAAARPASAPEAAAVLPDREPASPPEPTPEPPVAAVPEPEPASSEAAASQAVEPLLAAASAPEPAASGPTAFEWPVSTRLSYKLVGNWRGEVNGDAQVEWVHAGERYQVHLDVTVGLPIAPLFTRRMSSDGELTAAGLVPKRYDRESKLVFRDRQRATLLFTPDAVTLANGERRERWPGMQDEASQFVQLVWLFTTHPELLRVGNTIEMPLALPRNTYRLIYEVVAEEPVQTHFGSVPAFHLIPRRADLRGGDLRVEIWFAPQLRYLPARIRIEQDADVYVDLVLSRRPELAAR